MKKIFILACMILLASFMLQAQVGLKRNPGSSGNIRALLIVSAKLGANYNFNIDDLEEYGFDMTKAGPTASVSPCPWASSLGLRPLVCDTLLADVTDISGYDALIIMPARWRDGNAYQELINSQHVLSLIRAADSLGKVIYSTCAGPKVLNAAGFLQGLKVTGITEIKNEMIAAGAIWMGADTLPVIDSNIVTATRGMYYHIENMEAITTSLETMGFNKSPVQGSAWEESPASVPQGDVLWSKTYGGAESEGARAMISTPDGGYLMAGYTWSEGSGGSDILLIKTDADGNQLWTKTLGGNGWEYAYGLCASADGGYLVAGYTTSWGAGSKDMVLFRTDANGNESWHKTFGGTDIDVAKSVVQSTDGSILVCGYTQSFGAGEDDIMLVKADNAGNLKWIRTYGGGASELGSQVLVNNNQNYVLLGSTGSYGAGNRDIWLIETDTSGNKIWSKTFGDDYYQEAYAMIQTADQGYLVSGETDVHGVDLLNMYLVRTDSSGSLIWSKQLESPANFYEYGKGLCEIDDGSVVICGNLKYPADRTNDLFICKINAFGQLLWSESYGGTASDWGNAICRAQNNDVVVAGHTYSYGAGHSDVWMVKIHLPLVGINEKGKDQGLLELNTIQPNPFSDCVEIEFDIPSGKSGELQIFNSEGSKCRQFPLFSQGHHTVKWCGTDEKGQVVSPGMYYFSVSCGSSYSIKKVIRIGRN